MPLLTREGEVEIAKRIERGQIRVLKALSRSPIVIRELLAMGEDLKKSVRSIKEVVTFDEEEITDEILQNRLNEFTGKIDDMAKLYKKGQRPRREVRRGFEKKKPKDHRRARRNWPVLLWPYRKRCASCGFTNNERKRLIDRLNKTVDGMRSLDRQSQNLERKADATRSEEQKKEYRAAVARDSRRSGKAGTRNRRVVPGTQAHPARDHPGRHGCGAGQARADRGQPPPGGFDRQEIHQPRTAVPRPDSGRQHRPDESRGQIRIPPWLQIFHVRHVVDSAGHHPRHRRSGAYDSHPGAHDRNHQQADPHLASAGAGTGTRAYVGRNRQAHGHSGGESAESFEDRAGADLPRNANRRRGRFASGRLHRRPRRGFTGRSGDQREPEGPDGTGPAHADSARRKSHQDALRPRRRQRAHSGRSRAELRRHPRTHPPDRSQSPAQTAPSVALAEAAGVHGWSEGLRARVCHPERSETIRECESPHAVEGSLTAPQGTAPAVPFSLPISGRRRLFFASR